MEIDTSKPWCIKETDFEYIARSVRFPFVEIPAKCQIKLVKDSEKKILLD